MRILLGLLTLGISELLRPMFVTSSKQTALRNAWVSVKAHYGRGKRDATEEVVNKFYYEYEAPEIVKRLYKGTKFMVHDEEACDQMLEELKLIGWELSIDSFSFSGDPMIYSFPDREYLGTTYDDYGWDTGHNRIRYLWEVQSVGRGRYQNHDGDKVIPLAATPPKEIEKHVAKTAKAAA